MIDTRNEDGEESPLAPTPEEVDAGVRNANISEAVQEKIEWIEQRESLKKLGFKQWTSPDGKVFMAAGATVRAIPPGLYNVGILQDGTTFFSTIPLRDEKLLRLPDSGTEEVMGEIEAFWGLKEKFKGLGLLHKRGILLHGPSGSGKSCTIQLLVRDVVARGGLAINFGNPDAFIHAMRVFRNIQPETPLVVIMEDLEAPLRAGGGVFESKLLNILDGVEATIDHVVYVATTNFPEHLGQRIANRPSRFDRKISIPLPGAGARSKYLEFIGIGTLTPEEVERWTSDTHDLAFAHLKELFIGVKALGRPYDEVLVELKAMSKFISSDDRKEKMGFRKEKAELGMRGFIGVLGDGE